jgi:hypothetical protein
MEPQSSIAGGLDRSQIMRDEEQGGSLREDVAHPIETPLLESSISDRENLIDKQDRRLQKSSHRKPKPHLHAARVELDLAIDRILQFRKFHNLLESLGYFFPAETKQRSVEIGVLPAR